MECIVGVHPHERLQKQPVIISIELTAEIAPAIQSDDLADAVDYEAIANKIITCVEASSYQLVESLIEQVMQICLKHPKVTNAKVTLKKPQALSKAKTIAIEYSKSA